MSGHHPMRMSPGRARRGCGPEWCCPGVQAVSAGTVTTVRPRLCSTRRDTGGPRVDHTDRSTADHSVRGEAGTDEEEPAPAFGSEAGKDQHYVLDAAHTTKGMTAQ